MIVRKISIATNYLWAYVLHGSGCHFHDNFIVKHSELKFYFALQLITHAV